MDLNEILPEFQAFLRDRRLATEKKIPYHALWASRFLRFAQRRPEHEGDALVLEFLENARSRWSLADWQVGNVEETLKLYRHHYGGMVAPQAEATQEPKGLNLSAVLSETKRLLRLKHYSYRTEQTYLDWIKRFFEYTAGTKKTEGASSAQDVKDFLSHLAIVRRVSSSTQNQAFNTLLFLFREVLRKDLDDLSGTVRAKRGVRLPVVLSVDEMQRLLSCLSGRNLLIAQLLYGAGLRLMECARVRVQDIDFEANAIFVRSGKGDNDRTTMLPKAAMDGLLTHLEEVRALHEKDRAAGYGDVYLPDALARKYPKAGKEWGMSGVNIREVQELLGHKHVETTMIYTHVLRDMKNAPQSPLDTLMNQGP
jgi:integrase